MADWKPEEMPESSKVEYRRRIGEYISKVEDANGKEIDCVEKKKLPDCLMTLMGSNFADQMDEIMKFFDFKVISVKDRKKEETMIPVSEIIANLDVFIQHEAQGEELLKCFQKIDKNKSNHITAKELKTILTMEGPNKMKEKDADDLIDELKEEFDHNKDGYFSYPEFVRIIMRDQDPMEQVKAQSILKAEFDQVVLNEEEDTQQQQEETEVSQKQ